MAKNYEIAILIDFYGEMLTAKQRDFLEYYYNDDLSLSEIAENEALPARESVTLSRGRRLSSTRWRAASAWQRDLRICEAASTR